MIAILIESWYDSKYGDPHNVVSVLVVIAIFLFYYFLGYLLGFPLGRYYLICRLLFFDYCYNLWEGKKWYYLGNTSKWDKELKKYNKWLVLSSRIVLAALLSIL